MFLCTLFVVAVVAFVVGQSEINFVCAYAAHTNNTQYTQLTIRFGFGAGGGFFGFSHISAFSHARCRTDVESTTLVGALFVCFHFVSLLFLLGRFMYLYTDYNGKRIDKYINDQVRA